MIFILAKEDFQRIKKQLDGYVFWREEDGKILVRMATPNKSAERLLHQLKLN